MIRMTRQRQQPGPTTWARAGMVALLAIPCGLNLLTVILLLFSLWHASYTLALRLTLAFFSITAVTSWIFEEVRVASGLVFGPYHPSR